jgi:hypothetical protein
MYLSLDPDGRPLETRHEHHATPPTFPLPFGF